MSEAKLLQATWLTDDGNMVKLNGKGHGDNKMDLLSGVKVIASSLSEHDKRELAEFLLIGDPA